MMCACEFDWSMFANVMSGIGSIGAALFTILIFNLAKREWKKNNSISELELYYKLKADLYSEFSIKMYKAIVRDKLQFNLKNGTAEFSIDSEITSTSEVGLHFLGHIEDISIFLEEDIITFSKLNSGFGTMILEIGDYQPIRNYIKHIRRTYTDN